MKQGVLLGEQAPDTDREAVIRSEKKQRQTGTQLETRNCKQTAGLQWGMRRGGGEGGGRGVSGLHLLCCQLRHNSKILFQYLTDLSPCHAQALDPHSGPQGIHSCNAKPPCVCARQSQA